jgi:hypothetical protein
MHDVCVGWGFCGCVSEIGERKHVTNLIPADGEVTAEQFAEWVIQSDWPRDYDDPDYAPFRRKWVGRIAELFVKHLGAEPADATELRYGRET